MKKAVQYGAGNIGRGFIGQLFRRSGYEVVFIDVNLEIVNAINMFHSYPIEIMSEDDPGEEIIDMVRAVDGRDREAASEEIAGADIMATAVGANILPRIAGTIASGLMKRWARGNSSPLNIIVCENLIDAGKYLGDLIKKELPDPEKALFDDRTGLVEASIGRMVPIMTPEMQKGNILRICVEPYDTLPVDKAAFRGPLPEIVNMVPYEPFDFFIRRKLYIHNLGHAVTAYSGFLQNYNYIWESIRDPYIRILVSGAMQESAIALSMEYNVPLRELLLHVDNLINRFGNRLLGDTNARVGKDPVRKLAPGDRLTGSLELCLRHGISPAFISAGIASAFCFAEKGDPSALEIQSFIAENGIAGALAKYCGLEGTGADAGDTAAAAIGATDTGADADTAGATPADVGATPADVGATPADAGADADTAGADAMPGHRTVPCLTGHRTVPCLTHKTIESVISFYEMYKEKAGLDQILAKADKIKNK